MIGKFLTLCLLRKSTSPSAPLVQRLLVGLAAMLALTFIAALLAGVFVLGATYFAYQLLIGNGLEPSAALATVGVFVLFLIAAFAWGAVSCARSLRNIPKQLFATQAPLAQRASAVAGAFVDGLAEPGGKK